MIHALEENSLLALFLTISIGYAIGSFSFKGFKMGVAAVLFVGLLLGGLSESLAIDSVMIYMGLSLYIYSLGLGSGPTFFSNLNKKGTRDFGLVFLMLTLTIGLCLGAAYVLHIDPQTIAGVYAGSTTNTPALAGLIDFISQTVPDLLDRDILNNDAVAAYSLSYPLGIAGTLAALVLSRKILKIDYAQEANNLREEYPIKQSLHSYSVEIQNEAMTGVTIRDLKRNHHWKVVFGRLERKEGITQLCTFDTIFQPGDKVAIVGDIEELNSVALSLGTIMSSDITTDQEVYVTKRIFVSNPDIAGQELSTLNISENFSAIITRIQRGDMDILASSDAILELGDMVRFVVRREDLPRLQQYFGDSYESLGKINLFSFGFGLALGLFLGMITFHLPGDINFKLGYAGGPMIVALLLGRLRRTGNIVWTLPYSANQTIQQLGLAVLLAGIGINSGHTFFYTLSDSSSLQILSLAGVLSFVSAFFTLILGYKLLKVPFSILCGMVSHQPAILDYNLQQTGNKLPVIGYTLMMPIAVIIKIIYVQVLYVLLS